MEKQEKNVTEKQIRPMSGYLGILLELILTALSVLSIIGAVSLLTKDETAYGLPGGLLIALFCILIVAICILLAGFRILNPKEALVLTLFGNYYGTITQPGFYYVNPFCGAVNPAAKVTLPTAQVPDASGNITVNLNAPGTSGGKKVSLKTMTLDNGRQKVNDVLGNPIEIGAVVIWKVVNATQAVFNVDNYKTYLSIQCDSTIRNIARLYPYDLMDEDNDGEEKNEKTLRGSSQEIAEKMTRELQERVENAGIEVEEVRITHLAYAPEIAAAMLQRQQAVAIIAARQKIVEGAVGMVEMALNNLSENNVVELDDERKAAMVSNLLVVLCGNRDAQPIVNSGSLY